MAAKRAKPNPIVLGRRICNSYCGRWRPISDFVHKADRRADQGRYIAGMCSYCFKQYQKGWYKEHAEEHIERARQWKKANPELVKLYRERSLARLTPEERRRRERERYRRRYKDPRQGKMMREYARVYQAMKRHEARVAAGKVSTAPNPMKTGRLTDEDYLPIGPFQDWVLAMEKVYLTLGDLAKACGSSERLLFRYKMAKEGGETLTTVPITTVDACLTNEGTTGMWELYPQLFEDESDQDQIAA